MTIADRLKEIGEQQGIQKGMQHAMHLVAEKLFKDGQSLKYVADMTGLPEAELESLQRTLH